MTGNCACVGRCIPVNTAFVNLPRCCCRCPLEPEMSLCCLCVRALCTDPSSICVSSKTIFDGFMDSNASIFHLLHFSWSRLWLPNLSTCAVFDFCKFTRRGLWFSMLVLLRSIHPSCCAVGAFELGDSTEKTAVCGGKINLFSIQRWTVSKYQKLTHRTSETHTHTHPLDRTVFFPPIFGSITFVGNYSWVSVLRFNAKYLLIYFASVSFSFVVRKLHR